MMQCLSVLLLRRRAVCKALADHLSDSDGVPAGVGHHELADAVTHVFELADSGEPARRNLPQMLLEARPERLIQCIYIVGEGIAAATLESGIMRFCAEELHLNDVAPHSAVGVGTLLIVGDLEAQGVVEVHNLVNRLTLQEWYHLLRHVFCPPHNQSTTLCGVAAENERHEMVGREGRE